MRTRLSRLTPATWIALTALVVALAAPPAAFALGKNSVGSWHLKQNAVKSRHIGFQHVKALDIKRGAVTTGKLRRGAVTSGKLANGSVGPAKMRPGAIVARAHGYIRSDGSVKIDESRNLTDAHVTRAETGFYCIHDLPFRAVNAVATSSFANGAQPVVRTGGPGCPLNTSLSVELRTTDRGNLNTPFRIVIFGG